MHDTCLLCRKHDIFVYCDLTVKVNLQTHSKFPFHKQKTRVQSGLSMSKSVRLYTTLYYSLISEFLTVINKKHTDGIT